jgi:hypothetical protein
MEVPLLKIRDGMHREERGTSILGANYLIQRDGRWEKMEVLLPSYFVNLLIPFQVSNMVGDFRSDCGIHC